MSKKTIVIKSWPELLSLSNPYEEFLQLLRSSPIVHSSPQDKRKELWLKLVLPDFATDCQSFYKEIKLQKQVTISASIISTIKSDAQKTFGLHLAPMNSDDKVSRIVSCLGIFVLKRADIGYHYGMTYIVGLLLSIFPNEADVFLLFCYIVEVVFPSDFFVFDNRQLGLHKELRIVVKMAEVLRPKLVATLKAVFKPTSSNTKQNDMTPFILFVKRTSEMWIKSLFVQYLMIEDTFRVWDNVLIHGFEFLLKFVLTLFSKHENFIKNSIKQETKALGLGITVDSLIIAGNLSRLKLLRKLEKLQIDKIIKKALSKNTYTTLKRSDFLLYSTELEKENIDRLIRLRQTKVLIKSTSLSYDTTFAISSTISSISSQDSISRGLFHSIINKELSWKTTVSYNFFTTFDQTGIDNIPVKHLKLGLAVMTNCTTEEKLMLIYLINDVNSLGKVAVESICETVTMLEEVLDYRSKAIKNNILGIKQNLLSKYPTGVQMHEFVDLVLTDKLCEYFLKILNSIESNEVISSIEMNIVNIATEGNYSETHSPMRNSSINTPKSDNSYEGPDFEELEYKLNKIVKTFNDDVERSPVHVAFEYEDSDCEGIFHLDIEINYEFHDDLIKFVFHIGANIGNETAMENFVFQSKGSKTQEFQEELTVQNSENKILENAESTNPIDFPEIIKESKDRSGCSRLCSTQKCLIY